MHTPASPYPAAAIRAAVDFLILERDASRLLDRWEALHAEQPLGEATVGARSAYSLSAGERNQARRRLLILCGQDGDRADALCALLRPLLAPPRDPESDDLPPEMPAPEGAKPPRQPPSGVAGAHLHLVSAR